MAEVTITITTILSGHLQSAPANGRSSCITNQAGFVLQCVRHTLEALGLVGSLLSVGDLST